MPISAIAFLILSATIAIVWAHYQLLGADEFSALDADNVSSLMQLIHIQLKTPISLDPLVYNVSAYGAMRLFGVSAFALRLPSMCGYLLMQICLFYFVRRIATERAATVALALPVLIGSVMYSVQGRPYGLLLGLSALAMVNWQTVTRCETKRAAALVFLSLSVALAINTHYYGVLLLIPLCGAELFRTFERRRLDLPVLLSISLGMAGILILLPFAKAVSQFRAHYFQTGKITYHFITHFYLWMMIGYEGLSVPKQHILGLGLAFILLCLIAGFIRFHSSVRLQLPRAEFVFLALLSTLPIFGFLLARYVTEVIEGRYTLPAMIGIVALLAILIAPLLQNRKISRIILISLFVAIVGTRFLHIRFEKKQGKDTMASLALNAETQHNLEIAAGQPIYVTNPTVFFMVSYYSPNPDIRSRIRLMYSREEEMRNQHSDHLSLTGANMQADGVQHVVPYKSVPKHGTENLFLLYHERMDWAGQALADSHAEIKHLGQIYGWDLVSARFP
jgi:hypothetical protein